MALSRRARQIRTASYVGAGVGPGGGGGGAPFYVATSDELVVFTGQSQTLTQGVSGAGGLPAEWVDTPRVKMWGTSSFSTYSPAAASTWGPEVAYALDWLAANAGNAFTLYIVKHAKGGTQLGDTAIYGAVADSEDWSQTSGELFVQATNKINAAKAVVPGAVQKDIFFHQVESDAGGGAITNDYDVNLTEAFAKMRQLWGPSTVNITTHTVRNNATHYATVLAKQRAVMALNPKNFLVDTKNFVLQGDGIHWTAASSIIAGRADYKLTHGGLAPEDVILSANSVVAGVPAGTVVATISSVCRDGKSDVTYALKAVSPNFEIVGTQLKVKSGAPVTATVENITIIATSASGSYEETFPITITNQWWMAGAVADIDEENDRYYVNGVEYDTKAAMTTAGVYVNDGTAEYLPTAGWLPTAYSIVFYGQNAASVPGVAEYAVGLDDGDDGVATDEFIALFRGTVSATLRNTASITAASAAQLDNSTFGLTTGVADSAATKLAMRVQANSCQMASNGTAGPVDTAVTLPTITRLVLGNRSGGGRPWTGVRKRTTILSTALNQAQLVTATS